MKAIILFFLIINILLCKAQIPTFGLLANYTFAGSANDMSGNGNNGIVNGAVLTLDRFGQADNAYSFDGVNDYIDLNNHVSSFNFPQPASISFWVNTKYDIGQAVYSTNDGSSSVLYEENIYIAGNVTGTLSNEIIVVSSQRDVPDNYITGFITTQRDTLVNTGWHHIVVVYNDISTQIYLDNVPVSLTCNFGSNTGHFGDLPIATKTTLGARYNGGYAGFFHGSLDDIRIYNVALTQADVTQLFQETISSIETSSYANNCYQVYPNPAQDYFMINLGNNLKSSSYTILIQNNLGQTVYKTETSLSLLKINVKDIFNKGFYFVNIFDINNNLIAVKKVILN